MFQMSRLSWILSGFLTLSSASVLAEITPIHATLGAYRLAALSGDVTEDFCKPWTFTISQASLTKNPFTLGGLRPLDSLEFYLDLSGKTLSTDLCQPRRFSRRDSSNTTVLIRDQRVQSLKKCGQDADSSYYTLTFSPNKIVFDSETVDAHGKSVGKCIYTPNGVYTPERGERAPSSLNEITTKTK